VVGWRAGVLSVRVTAPPLEGEANRAVTDLLAEALGLRRAAVSLIRGERGRDKLVRVHGMTEDEIRQRLQGAAGAAAALSRRRMS
jgi:uncharacterized protein (TIGR00251 family)